MFLCIEGNLNMNNKWKAIWNGRKPAADALAGSWQEVFLELKRLNGYDVMGDGISLKAFLEEDAQTRELLGLSANSSVFEVGCGTGANIYLMARDGMTVGGTDYAESLIETARKVLTTPTELYSGEADTIATEQKYDAVFSNGVFPYFPDEAYVERVLARMLEKSRGPIGIMGLHDIEKKEDYLAFRRANIPNYDELYKGLDRLFYSRSLFKNFAAAHNLDVKFPEIALDGYWNTPFIFNCFMYRK